MTHFSRKAAAGAAGLAVALGAGGAAAWAAVSSDPTASGQVAATTAATPTPAGSSARHGGRAGKARSLLDRSDHITFEVKVRGHWVTYDLDRGTVSSISATSITLARPDGQSVTEAINPSTHFVGVSSESSVVVDKKAAVVSLNGVAVSIRQAPAAGTSSSFSNPSAVS